MLANPTGPSGGGVSIQRMNRQLVESSESAKTVEQGLLKFRFPFKTSKFNTKDQKLGSIISTYANGTSPTAPVAEYSNIYPDGDITTDAPVILMELKENFDSYQVFGHNWGTSIHGGSIEPIYELKYDYTYDYWLESFMEDMYNMPDEDEWDQIDVYDIGGIEPGGYPIEFGVPKPFPNWEDYMPGYADWDNRRHQSKWPFGSRRYPTAFEIMNAQYGEPTFAFYAGWAKHGFINWNGKNVVLPDGKLTDAEVNQAAGQAPDPPGNPGAQFQVQVYTPPTLEIRHTQ